MNVEREDRILKALEERKKNPKLTYRALVSMFNIPLTTLLRRAHGGGNAVESHRPQKRFTVEEEEELEKFIIEKDVSGDTMNHSQIREIVIIMLKLKGDPKPLGRKWVSKFVNDRSNLETLKGTSKVVFINHAADMATFKNSLNDIPPIPTTPPRNLRSSGSSPSRDWSNHYLEKLMAENAQLKLKIRAQEAKKLMLDAENQIIDSQLNQ